MCLPLIVAATSVRAQDTESVGALTSALRAAISRSSPVLDARRAGLAAAQARLRATGFRAPTVLAAEAEEIPDGLNLGRAGSLRVEVQQELLSGGRAAAARALAAVDVAGAEARLAAAEFQLAALADQRLVQWAGWTLIAARLAAEDSLLADAEEALRARFAVGGARYVDVLRIRSERLRTASDRAMAQSEAVVGRRLLIGLGGRQRSAALARALDSALAATPGFVAGLISAPLPEAATVESLLAASTAIRIADVAVSRAQAAQRLIRAEQRPRFAAVLGVQRFVNDVGRMTAGPVIGGSVSLPFTARRSTSAAALAAAREVDAAQADREATAAAVGALVEAAHDRYEAARARLSVFASALLSGARQEREGALATYRSGELPLIELLDFERALARAEIERIRARIDAADALAELALRASGEDLSDGGSSRTERGGR